MRRSTSATCATPARAVPRRPGSSCPRIAVDEFVAVSRRVFDDVRVGDPWDPATVVGPLIREEHRRRGRGLRRAGGRRPAARSSPVAGGRRLTRGYFVNPTLVGDVSPDSEIAQEEIFGPVAALFTYRDVDDAVRLANHAKYGLAAYVYGADLDEARALAARLRAGSVYINGGGGIRAGCAVRRLGGQRHRPRVGCRGRPRVPGASAHPVEH